MRRDKLPVSQKMILERATSFARQAPQGLESLPVHVLILFLRNRLHMTQAQLAKRAGLPQSHIAKIEKGRVDPQVGTLQKIFKALFCDWLVLPKPEKELDIIVAEQARETARKKVLRVMGSMALEKQLPENEMIQELIRAEQEKLMAHPSSEIWEDQ